MQPALNKSSKEYKAMVRFTLIGMGSTFLMGIGGAMLIEINEALVFGKLDYNGEVWPVAILLNFLAPLCFYCSFIFFYLRSFEGSRNLRSIMFIAMGYILSVIVHYVLYTLVS